MGFRRRTWEIIDIAKPGDRLSKAVDIAMLALIFLNVLAAIIGSVQSVQSRWGAFLDLFEIISVAIFTVEYIGRLWSCPSDPRFRGPVSGRFRLARQPMMIIDLLSILPFYLPFVGSDLRTLRALRLLRILRIAKIGRYYASMNLMKRVLQEKKEELVLSLSIMALLLIISSSVLYHCEYAAQPDAFSSIPATMWWAVCTLTTVGYGDMLPVTPLGKCFAGVIAVLGIGMFAVPTGILGAGFVEAIPKRSNRATICPHCGKEIH